MLSLTAGVAQIRQLYLPDFFPACAVMAGWLGSEQHSRAERLRDRESALKFVAAHGVLRWLLACALNSEPAAVRFRIGEKGKPYLADSEPDRGLTFNLSHSGDYAMIALALDSALGIDIERWKPIKTMASLVERCFAPAEQAYWFNLPERERAKAFFRFWTAKEAFVKATGAGISLGLHRCVIDLGTEPRLIDIPAPFGDPAAWKLFELPANGGFSAFVCGSRMDAIDYYDSREFFQFFEQYCKTA